MGPVFLKSAFFTPWHICSRPWTPPPPPPPNPPPVGVGWVGGGVVVGLWGGGWVVGWLASPPPLWGVGWVVGWWGGGVVGWLGGWVVGWLGVVRSWFRLGGLV